MTGADENAGDDKTWLLVPPFRREGAFGWVAGLPAELHVLTDTNEEPHRSRLRLAEAGRALGPAHSSHETIRRMGRGSYSFWGDVVYFSSTDGSDPNTKASDYTVMLAALRSTEGPSVVAPTEDPPLPWSSPDRPLRCAVFGLGNRGIGLGILARSFAGIEIAWVVDQS